MQSYELKLFGPAQPGTPVRVSVGTFSFTATDNLTAIQKALQDYAGSLATCDYAILRHAIDGQTVIWESRAPHT